MKKIFVRYFQNCRLFYRQYSQSYICFNLKEDSKENNMDVNNGEDQHNIKPDILDASLSHVNELGWSKYALVKGALSLGLPGVIQGVFNRGGFDLIEYFNSKCNEQFEILLKEKFTFANRSLNQEIPTEFLIQAIQIRLSLIKPYLKNWPQVAVLSSYPPNIKNALGSLLETADIIRSYAGCRDGAGPGWYARRLKIAAIYRLVEIDFVRRAMSTKSALNNTQDPLRYEEGGKENISADRNECQLSNEECRAVSNLVKKMLMTGTVISRPFEIVCHSLENAVRPNDSRKIESRIQKLVENVHPTLALAKNLLGIRPF